MQPNLKALRLGTRSRPLRLMLELPRMGKDRYGVKRLLRVSSEETQKLLSAPAPTEQERCYLLRSPGLTKPRTSISCPENHFRPIVSRAMLHKVTLHGGTATWEVHWKPSFPPRSLTPTPQEPAPLAMSEALECQNK